MRQSKPLPAGLNAVRLSTSDVERWGALFLPTFVFFLDSSRFGHLIFSVFPMSAALVAVSDQREWTSYRERLWSLVCQVGAVLLPMMLVRGLERAYRRIESHEPVADVVNDVLSEALWMPLFIGPEPVLGWVAAAAGMRIAPPRLAFAIGMLVLAARHRAFGVVFGLWDSDLVWLSVCGALVLWPNREPRLGGPVFVALLALVTAQACLGYYPPPPQEVWP